MEKSKIIINAIDMVLRYRKTSMIIEKKELSKEGTRFLLCGFLTSYLNEKKITLKESLEITEEVYKKII